MESTANRTRVAAKGVTVLTLLALVVSGCDSPAERDPTQIPTPPPSATQKALQMETLMNMTYTLPDGREVALRDGVYQEKPSADSATYIVNVSLTWEFAAFGDLTGDGVEDAALILTDAPGGSGTFVYLAAVVPEAGMPVNVDTLLLGDRVRIDSHTVQDGQSKLAVVTHGPDDPMCCPSESHVWGHALVDGKLVPTTDELVGTGE